MINVLNRSKLNKSFIFIGDSIMKQQFEAFLCMLDHNVIIPQIHLDEASVEVYNSTVVKYIPAGRLWKLYNPGMHSFSEIVGKVMNKSCRTNNMDSYANDEFVIINQGVHHNIEEKIMDNKDSRIGLRAQALATSMAYSVSKLCNNRSRRNQKVFWRETTPQHFATSDGNFNLDSKCSGQGCKSCIITSFARDISIRDTSNFRNDITSKIIEKSGITIVPIFEPLYYSPFNLHLDRGDCTHYNIDGLIFINRMCLTHFFGSSAD